jgi:hypothetical protein
VIREIRTGPTLERPAPAQKIDKRSVDNLRPVEERQLLVFAAGLEDGPFEPLEEPDEPLAGAAGLLPPSDEPEELEELEEPDEPDEESDLPDPESDLPPDSDFAFEPASDFGAELDRELSRESLR